jgi:hypothetical protein
MNVPKPAKEVVQKVDFVWESSEEEREGCPAEEEEEEDDDDDDDDEAHYHLSMSLRNIAGDLIESKEALLNLMKTIEDEFDLELVVHGCQVLPHGATTQCLGILDDGHISLYAWPEESVLLFDLFTEEKEVGIDDMKRLAGIFKQEGSQDILVGEDFNFGMESSWALRQRGNRKAMADYDFYMEDGSDLKKNVSDSKVRSESMFVRQCCS